MAKPLPEPVLTKDLPPAVNDKAAVRNVCPQAADFLNQIVAVFGTPKAIEVRDKKNRVIYRYGRFDATSKK